MFFRVLVAFILSAMFLVFSGCGKKKKEVSQETAQETPVDTTVSTSQTEEETAPFENPTFTKKGYCLQIYSFKDYNRAKEAADKFTARGYTTYIEDIEVVGEGVYHRVRIGSFATAREANRIGREIKSRFGVDYWVDRD